MLIKSFNHLRGRGLPVFFVLVILILTCAGYTGGDTPGTNIVPGGIPPESAGNPAADDLAAKINKLLKKELEKEFGPLEDRLGVDDEKPYGHLIAIDYQLPKDKRLDDTWGVKVVEALGRLGITTVYEGDEVRGEKQKIAGQEAMTIQITTQRTLEDPDVIAFTAMFPRKR